MQKMSKISLLLQKDLGRNFRLAEGLWSIPCLGVPRCNIFIADDSRSPAPSITLQPYRSHILSSEFFLVFIIICTFLDLMRLTLSSFHFCWYSFFRARLPRHPALVGDLLLSPSGTGPTCLHQTRVLRCNCKWRAQPLKAVPTLQDSWVLFKDVLTSNSAD